MSDIIYYCIKSNNDCPLRNKCARYLSSDSHNSKITLFKNACTALSNRILFIKTEYIDEPDDSQTKEDDSTEQTD